MATPFRKAEPKQAFVKLGFYGPQGSGKTFTALLCAEGLARETRKRIAYIDTEHGTDFYAKTVQARPVHPNAFDFDAVYTRNLSEGLAAARSLDPKVHGVCILDSITHMWEAAMLAYAGKETAIGSIPFQAWGKIKKPYKALLDVLMSLPMHVIICGRQRNIFGKNDETGDLECVGVGMKAESETPYEPHICIRLEAVLPHVRKDAMAIIYAYPEKDRTGVLSGRVIEWPSFENVIRPILPLLGGEQARIPSEDERRIADQEALEDADETLTRASTEALRVYTGRLMAALTPAEIDRIGAELTPERKKTFTAADLATLRNTFLAERDRAAKVSQPVSRFPSETAPSTAPPPFANAPEKSPASPAALAGSTGGAVEPAPRKSAGRPKKQAPTPMIDPAVPENSEPMTVEELDARVGEILPDPVPAGPPIGMKSPLYQQMAAAYRAITDPGKRGRVHQEAGTRLATDWAGLDEASAQDVLAIIERISKEGIGVGEPKERPGPTQAADTPSVRNDLPDPIWGQQCQSISKRRESE